MKVFVAGASGAIGKYLLPLLVQAGHTVTGMTRSQNKVDAIRAAGANAEVANALNPDAVESAVRRAKPDVIVHELTAIPAAFDIRNFAEQFKPTNRLRTVGTNNLLAAARSAGVRRVIAQSYACWPYARIGGGVKTEADPFDPNPPQAMRETLDAIRHVESAVLEAPEIDGIILRYGALYGPGNAIGEEGIMLREIRKRHIPIIGGGTGIWSFIHVEDAARATVAAVDRGEPGIYNIVDDEPAKVSEWLPYLADILGAKPPIRIPAWLGKLAIGTHGVVMMTDIRGASNQKAKDAFGWQPIWGTWRDGFLRGLSESILPRPAMAGRNVASRTK